jgi:hypothetical protein
MVMERIVSAASTSLVCSGIFLRNLDGILCMLNKILFPTMILVELHR